MPDQPDYETQEPSTPQELRQSLLDAIDTQRQAIEQLSDEELETITGGARTHREDEEGQHVYYSPSLKGKIAHTWDKMPTAFKAEGIASAVVGPITALSVGTISQVIANRS